MNDCIRQRRRGSRASVNIPIFVDTNTPRPFIDPHVPQFQYAPLEGNNNPYGALPDHIHLDAMAFGGGCCCLQVTFQAADVDQARRVYDALIPVAPIMVCIFIDVVGAVGHFAIFFSFVSWR